jgi:hypothetical protein
MAGSFEPSEPIPSVVVSDVSRSEFEALADRVAELEQRQDAHAVVVAPALQRSRHGLGRVTGGSTFIGIRSASS